MAESGAPAAPPARAGGGRSRLLIVAVVILVIALIAVSAYALIPKASAKLPVELWYNNSNHYGSTEVAVALALQNSIASCGKVQVTLKSDIWTAYKTRWVNQQMPLFLLGWYPDYFDTDDYISPFLAISGAKSEGSFYNNSQVDQWIRDEASTSDPTIRADRFAKVQAALAEDVPYIPLFTGAAQVAYVNGVQNVELHPVSYKWFIVNKPGATVLNASTSDHIISLDPASAYDFMSIEVINQVFDTLLVYDAKTTALLPGLATEVPTVANGGVSADGKNYTFHLRQGVTFSDGTAFNSTVVKRSIDRTMRLDLAGSAAFLLYDVGALRADHAKGNSAPGVITTPDPYNITFHLFSPVSFFNQLMAFSVSAPVPWTYSQIGEQPSTVGNVIGTGPYVLSTHTVDQLVVLNRNPTYYKPDLYAVDGISRVPQMDRVVINIKSTDAALKQDIETKAVDVAFRTISPVDLADLQGRQTSLGITVKLGSSPQIRFLVFNVNLIPDKRVRQAIAYSIDRSAINSLVFLGQVSPLYSMIPAELPYASPVFQSRYGDAQCASANALLSQVGYTIEVTRELVAVARDR